ncbi:MAG: SRPBCC family protein [Dehalococcoidia bacterium]
MPTIERSIVINVPPERVWEAFVNLGDWPVWNPHMRKVRLLTEVPLAMGSRARIVLKTGFSSTWKVTEFTPGRSFTWDANLLGSHLSFAHLAEPANDATRVVFRIEASGPTAAVASLVLRFSYSRFLDHSLRRLKERLEKTPA